MDTKHLVDPELAAVVAMQAPFPNDAALIPAIRPHMNAFMEGLSAQVPLDGVQFAKRKISVGAEELEVHVYQPANTTPNTLLPAMLWIHGGGYMVGTPAMDHLNNVEYCRELGIVIVAPDYRLAPEHPYPVPVEDCYAALQWLHSAGRTELNVDHTKIAVGGASAGGGLAAAVAHLAKDRNEVKLVHQLLMYPMIDDRTVERETLKTVGHILWNRDLNKLGWGAYLGKYAVGADDVPVYAAPSRATAKALEGLPSTTIIVGSLDLFLEENMEYARQLIGASVDTNLRVIAGAPHGWDLVCRDAASTKEVSQFRKTVLKKALFGKL